MKPLQWFIDRIGKRVYRNSNGCSCARCKRAEENGEIIEDIDDASDMFDHYLIYNAEGFDLRYADTKQDL